ncbi:MAG: hypothetical protein V4456_13525 [Bacteroidota bacterium]
MKKMVLFHFLGNGTSLAALKYPAGLPRLIRQKSQQKMASVRLFPALVRPF